MNLMKQKPPRSKKYLLWVASLPCCVTGVKYNVIAHHIIDCGLGGTMAGKASDLLAIPLNTVIHGELHHNTRMFEEVHDQKKFALQTLENAVNAGVLKIE